MDPKELYSEQFRKLPPASVPWLASLRSAGMQRFAEQGFPSTRLEDWKYTSVRQIADVRFRPAATAETNGGLEQRFSPYLLAEGLTLIFLDGHFVGDRSQPGLLPAGVVVTTLARAIASRADLVEPHLARGTGLDGSPFTALNTAFLEDGGFVHLPKGTVLEAPIQFLFLSSSPAEPAVWHPRNLVVAEEGSRATIVETYVGDGKAVYFTNTVTELVVGPNAALTHYKLQREGEGAFHIGTTAARQGRDSRLHSMSLSLGGALARNEIGTVFSAPGSSCSLDGLYLASGRQHVDHHTSIDHCEPHCGSEQLYKGVLDSHASAVFNGKVFVRPDAQKSDARQVNKNLLLSEDAVVNTKPQLEIFADDVRCSHGATIGRLEKDALFYLRSRGIDESTARTLLIRGFVNEVLERVAVKEVRSQLEDVVRSRFGGPTDSETEG